MAYEVTATRRRPQLFDDLIGQEFVVATLQKSIASGKIAHAYLFSGPRGCGKTTSARILSKALNCEKGPTGTPCGECVSCTEIARGSSLDVIEIDGASNTSVNDVRQIKEEVQFPPNSCRYKVYIIDEVHMLSTNAFNALLKTIEEPPPYVVFIFATTELHKVPATIKSRCQQFNFRLVSVELLKEVLSQTAIETGLEAENEALFWIAREATGSVRDAYTLYDQVVAFSEGKLTFEKIRDKLGLVGIEKLNPVIEACVSGDRQTALLLIDEILQKGVSIEQCIVDLSDYFRNLLLIKCGIQKESLLGQRSDRFSNKVLQSCTSLQIERSLSILFQLYRDIRYSLDPRYEFELAISRMSWITDYVSPIEIHKAILDARSVLTRRSKADVGPFEFAACTQPEKKQAAQSLANETIDPNFSGVEETDRIENPFAEFKRRLQETQHSHTPISESPIQEKCPPLPVKLNEESVSLLDTSTYDTIAINDHSLKTIPFTDLKEGLVEHFQTNKNMIAAALQQSFDWKEKDDVVQFSVEKPFTHTCLIQEIPILKSTISQFLGKQVSIEIIVDASKSEIHNKKSMVPERIEMIRKIFRGTLV